MSMVLIKQILTGKFKLYYKANMGKAIYSYSFINHLYLLISIYFLHSNITKISK
jgi:uncharacterized membrane protein YcgQ (UPF0703/DUF1980 family)